MYVSPYKKSKRGRDTSGQMFCNFATNHHNFKAFLATRFFSMCVFPATDSILHYFCVCSMSVWEYCCQMFKLTVVSLQLEVLGVLFSLNVDLDVLVFSSRTSVHPVMIFSAFGTDYIFRFSLVKDEVFCLAQYFIFIMIQNLVKYKVPPKQRQDPSPKLINSIEKI